MIKEYYKVIPFLTTKPRDKLTNIKYYKINPFLTDWAKGWTPNIKRLEGKSLSNRLSQRVGSKYKTLANLKQYKYKT
jgi:hypothetical protein